MGISDLIDYLSTAEGIVTVFFGTLSSLSILWNPGRLLLSYLSVLPPKKRWSRQPGTDRAKSRVLTVPLRAQTNWSAESLAQLTRLWGRVPLRRRPSGRWFLGLGRRIRARALVTQTAPKGSFVVDQLRYSPGADLTAFGDAPYGGSFKLEIKVHANENRRHLRRSMLAARGRHKERRLVAIATTPDMADKGAPVRCLLVNARYGMTLDADAPGRLTLHSADTKFDGNPTAFLRHQGKIAGDAMWLILPLSECRPPTQLWGHVPERFDVTAAAPLAYLTVADAHPTHEGELQRLVKLDRVRTAAWWLLLGPALFFVARWLRNDLVADLSDPTATSVHLFVPISRWLLVGYFVAYAYFAIFALVDLLWQSTVGCVWRRQEHQSPWFSPRRGLGAIVAAFVPLRTDADRLPSWNGGTRSCMQVPHLLSRDKQSE